MRRIAVCGAIFFFLLPIARAADPDPTPRPARTIVLVNAAALCLSTCVCEKKTTPKIHIDDACIVVEPLDFVSGNNGCCDDFSGHPNCVTDACTLDRFSIRFKIQTGGACSCTKIDIVGQGADSNVQVIGHTGTGWTTAQWFGGTYVPCDPLVDEQTTGGYKVTCTEGGDPVPRLVEHIEYIYDCFKCGTAAPK